MRSDATEAQGWFLEGLCSVTSVPRRAGRLSWAFLGSQEVLAQALLAPGWVDSRGGQGPSSVLPCLELVPQVRLINGTGCQIGLEIVIQAGQNFKSTVSLSRLIG
jgi:hypothetical protein